MYNSYLEMCQKKCQFRQIGIEDTRLLNDHKMKIKIKRCIVMQHKIALCPQHLSPKIEVSVFTVLFETRSV